jgi:hypothetical protein
LADAHGTVLEALGRCVRSGVGLHVVGGNHDIELIRPASASLFTGFLGLEPGDPRVRFSPWVLHEPGVVYAEHGNQHHDLNRLPTLLSVRQAGDRQVDLPVTPLGAASAGQPWCPGEGAAVSRVARSLWAARRHEQLARTAWYQDLLAREAVDLAMSSQALAELAAVSRFGPGTALAATARRTVERRLGSTRPGTYLAPRAAAIHRILTRHGMPAAAYVFGHNHRAERLHLPGRPPGTYLNTGTWSSEVRGNGPDSVDPQLFPYVRVAAGPDGTDADLFFWSAWQGLRERRRGATAEDLRVEGSAL